MRAFALLEALAVSEGMNLGEIARQVRLPRSTVHRLLTTMEALRYVEFDRLTHRWAIGSQAFRVGAAFVQKRDLGQFGRSVMKSLVREFRHPVNIAIVEGDGVRIVAQETPGDALQPFPPAGARLPLHTTASGKMLMARWSADALDGFLHGRALTANTARSIVDPAALRRELAGVCDQGYAIDDEEQADGLRCVAASVLDRYGRPLASLSISDARPKLDTDRMRKLGPALTLAARKLSSEVRSQFGLNIKP